MGMRVGELARRTGVGVSALRAWERRYGLLQPERSPAGHRLYDEVDVERVNAVVRLVEEGLHLSVAVTRVSAGGPSALPVGEGEELLLGQILDRAGVGIWVARYGRTHYANSHLAQLLGYALDDLVQLPVFDFFAPEDMDRVRESTERVRAGETSNSTVRLRRADGTTVVVRMDASRLPSPTGAYIGAVAVVSDHTEGDRRDRLLQLKTSMLDDLAMLGSQALRARRDPARTHAVVAEAVDTARRLVRADEAVAFVHGPDGEDLAVLLASPDPAVGALGPVARTVAGFTRLARQPLHVGDTSTDRRFEQEGACSVLGVPIDGPAGPIGALVVVAGKPDQVDASGMHFLQSIANVIGGLVAT